MRADWDNKPEAFGISRICESCGKKFMPAVYHQYVDYTSSEMGHKSFGHKRRKKYFCSYTCFIHREEQVGSRGGKRIQVYDLNGKFIREFRDAQEASMWLSGTGCPIDNRMIQRCCRGEIKRYKQYIFKYKEIEL